VTLWTVRAACLFYAGALVFWTVRRPSAARLAWTFGFVCFLGHVLAAFAFHHGWSHRVAYAETARQTAALFGISWGGGLYWNYAFTVIWAADIAWMWLNTAGYRRRKQWISQAIHGFMAFMFFNGAVVFGSGSVRWLGLAVTAAVAFLWIIRRRTERPGLTSTPETRQTIPL
jgi:hypothetical protein